MIDLLVAACFFSFCLLGAQSFGLFPSCFASGLQQFLSALLLGPLTHQAHPFDGNTNCNHWIKCTSICTSCFHPLESKLKLDLIFPEWNCLLCKMHMGCLHTAAKWVRCMLCYLSHLIVWGYYSSSANKLMLVFLPRKEIFFSRGFAQ